MNQGHQTARTLTQAEAEALWSIYETSFAGCGINCAQDQSCYDQDLFMAAMADTDYVKVIAQVDGKAVGFALLTNNLEKARITYLNPEKLRRKYPQQAAENRIWYCTAMGMSPDAVGGGQSSQVFIGMATLLLEQRAILGYDFGDDKPEFTRYTDTMFKRALRTMRAQLDLKPSEVLGGQVYCTLEFC